MGTEPPESAREPLLDLVRPWLPGRRWFAGKGHLITDVRLCSATPLPGGVAGAHAVVGVQLDDAEWQVYQVPYVRGEAADPAAKDRVIGRLGQEFWCDAGAHPAALAVLLGNPSRSAEVDPARTHGSGEALAPQLQALAEPFYAGLPARALSVEQSNTSVRLGEAALLKIFRRLTPGINPDVEVHAALTAVGCRHIAAILGWTNGAWLDPASGQLVTGHLAMVQELVTPAIDGWELALQKVAAGADFAQESYELGLATGAVHRDLRRALPTYQLDHDELGQLVTRLQARLTRATEIVPEIGRYAAALRAGIARLATHPLPLEVQRVHGDFHLGQVLRSGESWKLLDFEGEPGADMAARALLDHPLRDVAGMLRSFAYAARVGGEHAPAEGVAAWREACQAAFVSGYQASGATDPAAGEVILNAYLIDKAAYEAVYEKRNRPGWLEVPLTALRELAESIRQ